MKPFINNYSDIMEFLDNQAESVSWDEFYELRNQPANFIIQNDVPDENLVEFFERGEPITSSIEFGCGEGRNAIFMAKQGVAVTAIDISATAIENANKLLYNMASVLILDVKMYLKVALTVNMILYMILECFTIYRHIEELHT